MKLNSEQFLLFKENIKIGKDNRNRNLSRFLKEDVNEVWEAFKEGIFYLLYFVSVILFMAVSPIVIIVQSYLFARKNKSFTENVIRSKPNYRRS